MIYENVDTSQPIRQGDIFVGVPRIDMSLERVLVIQENGEIEANWSDIAKHQKTLSIIVPVKPVAAIVATQDCDALRSRDITLCEIREFRDVELKSKDTTAVKSWKNLIIQHAKINNKWFYLPPDSSIGFPDKMAVDFMVTIRVPRSDLEALIFLRKGRLNHIADEHFRERISEFFRRYPYDEWYALDRKELQAYVREYPGTIPYPWQSD